MIKNILNWIVTSSKDPNDVSLTLKGALVMVSPTIVLALGIFKIPVDGTAVSQIIDLIVAFVHALFAFGGAALLLIGGIRKVSNTVKGLPASTGPVIVSQPAIDDSSVYPAGMG